MDSLRKHEVAAKASIIERESIHTDEEMVNSF